VLDDIRPTEQDTLVILGDVIDRGSDSRGVIERLMDLEGGCKLILLKGNHEEMLLGALQGRDDRKFWLACGGQKTLDSYNIKSGDPNEIPRAHLDFLKQTRPYFETETHIFVHANYDPTRTLDLQSSTTLLWRTMKPADAKAHISGKVAVVGHTVFPAMVDLCFLKCIDTGCGRGGPLTALDVLSGRLFVSGDSRGPDRPDAPTEETLHESAG
jgi:serine/threonine protein phosphatase 1